MRSHAPIAEDAKTVGRFRRNRQAGSRITLTTTLACAAGDQEGNHHPIARPETDNILASCHDIGDKFVAEAERVARRQFPLQKQDMASQTETAIGRTRASVGARSFGSAFSRHSS
jgi:hypothetical protein